MVKISIYSNNTNIQKNKKNKIKIKIIVVKKIVKKVNIKLLKNPQINWWLFSDIKKGYISIFSLDSEDSKILHNVI